MKLSIIIAVYESYGVVERLVKFWKSLALPDDIEFILVDDGSNPPHEGYDLKNLTIHYTNDKRAWTQGLARNAGVSIAKGEYIAIHDADDISFPTRLEQEINAIESDKSLFCVGGYAIIINESGDEIGKWVHPPNSNSAMMDMIANGRNPVINSSAMFRKYDFIKSGKYTRDKDIQLVHDLEFWGRCLFSGLKFCTLETPIIKYRINNSGLTFGRSSEMKISHQILLERWREKGLI